MALSTSINAVVTSIALLGIVYLMLWRSRALAVDWFRDKMFELRDELFDFASDGGISFDHPAYGVLRTTMNGFIRFCHRLSLLQIIVLALFTTRPLQEGVFNRDWKAVSGGLQTDVLNQLESYRGRMERLLLIYLMLVSPAISLILFSLVLLTLMLKSLADFRNALLAGITEAIRTSSIVEPHLRSLDDSAYATGTLLS